MSYEGERFILAHSSGVWEFQEHGASICLAASEPVSAASNDGSKRKGKRQAWKRLQEEKRELFPLERR